MTDETLLNLTVDIVSAHVSNNAVATDRLPQLIESIYGSLSGLGRVQEAIEEERAPAVSVRASVKPDGIVCLECGKKFKTIKRHLMTDHNLSVEDYRQRWNLPASYPVVSSEYAERRRELAKTIGLGRKPGTKVKTESSGPNGAKNGTKASANDAPDASSAAADEALPTLETAAKPKAVKSGVRNPKPAARKKLGISVE